MNHQKIYDKIISNARIQERIKQFGFYFERHHIIPKCLGGNDTKENLILLTAKEHYICHKLLTYIHPHNRKIACAYYRMTFSKNKNVHITSRNYSYAKELLNTIPVSEETKEKMRNHKFSDDHRRHISESLLGTQQSEETIEKRAKKHRGRKNTQETKDKMSLAAKDKPKQYDVWNKNKTFLNITSEIIFEIKQMKGIKLQREIAEMYNLSVSCVARIVNGFYDSKVR